MGYELMQVLQGDAGENFHSLDDLYYYGGQFAHEQVAIEDHVPENSNEIELKAGDTIGIAGNHWDGYSKGNNRRTQKTGLYPSYKVTFSILSSRKILGCREMEDSGLSCSRLTTLRLKLGSSLTTNIVYLKFSGNYSRIF